MTYGSPLYATEGRIARITLNRPERLNAIDDVMQDYRLMKRNTDDFASLWRSYKPTVCKVHGSHAAVEWRDSGRYLPDGEEARDLLRRQERE